MDIGPSGMTVQAIGCSVNGAQSGGTTTTTLGLYGDDGSNRPNLSNLIFSGTVTLTATGNRTAAITPTFLPYGRYWSAFLYVVSSAPTTAATCFGINNNAPLMYTANIAGIVRGLQITGQSSLPSTGTLTLNGGGNVIIVELQTA